MASSSKAIATTGERLPSDVTPEILYGLPVKSLIRFRCTSTEWNSVISDPQFAISHFKLASQRKTLTRRLLLSTSSQVQSLDVQTSSFGDDSSVANLTCPFKQPGRIMYMLGSCNGMVFVSLRDDDGIVGYYIWNPCTARFLKLPDVGIDESEPRVGFGYVSATDEYKVVVTACSKGYRSLHVFSSRANSWKMIEAPSHLNWIHRVTTGVLSNESLHWIGYFDYDDGEEDEYGKQIIAFDLAEEEFVEIALPLIDVVGDSFNPIQFFIDDLGGCLCVSACYTERNFDQFQFWVMMEYGVSESWTKVFQVSMVLDRLSIERPVFHTESSMVVWRFEEDWCPQEGANAVVRFDLLSLLHKDVAGCSGQYMVEAGECDMIHYEETLLWLNDPLGVEENVRVLGTQQAGLRRNN
ncbi:PREDICTED: F-box protein CPR30-like [Fragaria vesca subsp. vesca]|uniref:F-box protein CPR30-like n=1 Tax=Fragaria vesca subsp. vesca TaxID=101020 RepID=UPI0002C35846|nr:PREDICTED: F-box protein CPR30-like [Fragaria vesca subsp. vesca]